MLTQNAQQRIFFIGEPVASFSAVIVFIFHGAPFDHQHRCAGQHFGTAEHSLVGANIHIVAVKVCQFFIQHKVFSRRFQNSHTVAGINLACSCRAGTKTINSLTEQIQSAALLQRQHAIVLQQYNTLSCSLQSNRFMRSKFFFGLLHRCHSDGIILGVHLVSVRVPEAFDMEHILLSGLCGKTPQTNSHHPKAHHLGHIAQHAFGKRYTIQSRITCHLVIHCLCKEKYLTTGGCGIQMAVFAVNIPRIKHQVSRRQRHRLIHRATG